MFRRQNGLVCLENMLKDVDLCAQYKLDMIQITPFSARDRYGAVLAGYLKEKQS